VTTSKEAGCNLISGHEASASSIHQMTPRTVPRCLAASEKFGIANQCRQLHNGRNARSQCDRTWICLVEIRQLYIQENSH